MVAKKYGKTIFQFLLHEIFAIKNQKISRLGNFMSSTIEN